MAQPPPRPPIAGSARRRRAPRRTSSEDGTPQGSPLLTRRAAPLQSAASPRQDAPAAGTASCPPSPQGQLIPAPEAFRGSSVPAPAAVSPPVSAAGPGGGGSAASPGSGGGSAGGGENSRCVAAHPGAGPAGLGAIKEPRLPFLQHQNFLAPACRVSSLFSTDMLLPQWCWSMRIGLCSCEEMAWY